MQTRWKALPAEQQSGEYAQRCQLRAGPRALPDTTGIRNFIVQVTVDVSSDEARMRREKRYLNKLNLVLVQVSGGDGVLDVFGISYRPLLITSDSQTSMAQRLALIYPRNRRFLSHITISVRKQHDYPPSSL